jgi:hypothetical protein
MPDFTMMDFLFQAVRLVNLPYTLLLGITGIYWIIVILGFLDIEVFDIDIDLDLDMDADLNFGSIFSMLNVGALPFSIWLSIFILQMWVYSIVANLLLDAILPLPNLVRLLLCAIVFLPVAGIMTKVFTNPLKTAFEGRESIGKKDFVGKECLITSSQVTPAFGTAQLILDGVPQLIDIRAKDENDVFKKGDAALIYSYNEERDVFYVTSM